MQISSPGGWEGELERWLAPFLAALNREAQRRWAPVYLKGLLLPGERKSVEPLAARVAPGDTEQLHHFISGPPWATGPLEAILTTGADRLVGGPDAVRVIDDTALPKQGRHSVGVARQYCGALGKRANCQVLVSLTLARGEVPLPVGLRLFLPEAWAADPARCARAGVPEEHRRPLAETGIALEEIDRVLAAGAHFGRVVADAGYGISAAFRQGLSERELSWAAGVPKVQNVYPAGGGRAALAGRPRREAPQAPGAERGAGPGRGHAGGRRAASDQLAAGHQGPARGRVRRPEGAPGRGGAAPERLAPARGRGLAGGRASGLGRAQVPPLRPAGGRAARGAGGAHQSPVGVRAGAPAARGGAGPRPLRGPLLARAAPPRAPAPARLRLPAAPTAAGAGGRAAPGHPDRHLGRRCPRCAAASSPRSPRSCRAAPTAGSASPTTSGSECPRVVLVVRLRNVVGIRRVGPSRRTPGASTASTGHAAEEERPDARDPPQRPHHPGRARRERPLERALRRAGRALRGQHRDRPQVAQARPGRVQGPLRPAAQAALEGERGGARRGVRAAPRHRLPARQGSRMSLV